MQLRKADYRRACANCAEWRSVAGYEGMYEIHWRGIVRNAATKHVLSPGLGGVGYFTVSLNHKSYTVHRLVALNYIPNPEGKEMVNHIDGNKKNNHLANLEWATRSENEKHGHALGLKKPPVDKIPVLQIDAGGNIVNEYTSMTEAEANGFSSGNIARACKRGIKHKGYFWKHKNTY
jgi:hypothetical protein